MALRLVAISEDIMCDYARADIVAGAEAAPQTGPHHLLRDDRLVSERSAAAAIFGGDARAEQPRRTGAPPGVAIDDALGFPAFGMRHQLARDELGRFVGEHRELVVPPWRALNIESFN